MCFFVTDCNLRISRKLKICHIISSWVKVLDFVLPEFFHLHKSQIIENIYWHFREIDRLSICSSVMCSFPLKVQDSYCSFQMFKTRLACLEHLETANRILHLERETAHDRLWVVYSREYGSFFLAKQRFCKYQLILWPDLKNYFFIWKLFRQDCKYVTTFL